MGQVGQGDQKGLDGGFHLSQVLVQGFDGFRNGSHLLDARLGIQAVSFHFGDVIGHHIAFVAKLLNFQQQFFSFFFIVKRAEKSMGALRFSIPFCTMSRWLMIYFKSSMFFLSRLCFPKNQITWDL